MNRSWGAKKSPDTTCLGLTYIGVVEVRANGAVTIPRAQRLKSLNGAERSNSTLVILTGVEKVFADPRAPSTF